MTDPRSGTIELDGSFLETLTFEGREFQKHAVENEIYYGPIDDEEIDRLDLQHRVLSGVFDHRLIFPPLESLDKVLDCGYGSGAWAVEVAEQYETCDVIGVDVSPHMRPDDTPDNLWLQVDDLNRHFTFGYNQFDLVHSRLVASGINQDRWPRYLRDIVRSLKRGGWAQMVEIYFNIQSDNGALTENHALRKWSSSYIKALEGVKDVRVGMKLTSLMTSAGLVDIESKMIPLPLSGWSNGEYYPLLGAGHRSRSLDPRMRVIGAMNRDNTQQWLSSLALYPFMQKLHMSRDELNNIITRAREEADDPSLRPYVPL
ncbi:hypothetical protein CPC735_022050 [Coccidioides posadasii C735 delta SOWgp]|uniref:Methyltransferase domain-containing protein n=1 Tax=Coccidioides posadasii (strain C735) TaxID=222929 RepID=C5PJK7_COCP7|nr:hypothetical protein CPC735_022050 [Coccidioides posadasii C735 delta SOWgp]EER22906.1 hypothetical protein CPC735_022050 [Coccidioides posadasii C735 delta SOWgp]|eukprot:XP_003065051.1 hypothetical protein CPC735_022050 [Coccidioides posadasii C735 delta SOWgp]